MVSCVTYARAVDSSIYYAQTEAKDTRHKAWCSDKERYAVAVIQLALGASESLCTRASLARAKHKYTQVGQSSRSSRHLPVRVDWLFKIVFGTAENHKLVTIV